MLGTKHGKLLLTVALISLGGAFQYGYQVTSINPTQYLLANFLNMSYSDHYHHILYRGSYSILWSVVVNIYFLGALLGVAGTPFLADLAGRRSALCLGSVICIVGNVLMGSSKYLNSFELMIVARLLLGVGIGASLAILPVFIVECSPERMRGPLSTITGLFIQIGVTVGSIVSQEWSLGTRDYWSLIFFCALAPNVLALLSLWFAEESPKYLASLEEVSATQLRRSLIFYHGPEVALDQAIAGIMEEVRTVQTGHVMTWRDVWRVPHIRTAVALGSVINAVAGFCGIAVYTAYTTFFLTSVGLSIATSMRLTIATSATTILGALMAMVLVDRVGRRPLLIYGHIALQALNVIILLFATLYSYLGLSWARFVVIVGVFGFLLVYGAGPVTVSWFITAELVPQKARSVAQGTAVACGWLGRVVAGFVYLPLEGTVGHFALLFYVLTSLPMILYVALRLPETKGKRAVDIISGLKHRGSIAAGCGIHRPTSGPLMVPADEDTPLMDDFSVSEEG